VKLRFLLGPAGSGKTFRCLREIREQLRAAPDGPPLILLAPKQATFQLERQLLQDESTPGFTRLRILSFERLAGFILELLDAPPLPLLSEEGRTMVLRALLSKHRGQLGVFRESAISGGFARQLSRDLRELQQHQLTPEKLAALSAELEPPLSGKLRDIGLIYGAYLEWLRKKGLRDGDCLLDLAAGALRRRKVDAAIAGAVANPPPRGQLDLFDSTPERPGAIPPVRLGTLWLDGFAEMTPGELDLLTEVAACCETVTLAFCVEGSVADAAREGSWLSIWSGVGRTYERCRQRMEVLPGVRISVEPLAPSARYDGNPALQHLERRWTRTEPFEGNVDNIRLVSCADPAGEAVMAAREILRFVRAGGRFREVAVLLRGLEGYHNEIRRAFASRGIPCFLDRRESVAHHPLAELVRYSLATIAFDWRREDWFGALKTGFVNITENAVDELENEALARGWNGRSWFEPLIDSEGAVSWAETLRERLMPPFLRLRDDLTQEGELACDGRRLAEAMRTFWAALRADRTLNLWSEDSDSGFLAPHATVWESLNAWLDDVALAFSDETMPLREWLPVLESSLGGLSVGVIPPSLDQVLVGAIDRSRNPELKLAIVLGVNESVFPRVPENVSLLTDIERDQLEQHHAALGPGMRELLSRERFLGYIACTRSAGRLVVSHSRVDGRGAALNPSPLLSHLRGMFPGVRVECLAAGEPWPEAEHSSELTAPLLRAREGWDAALSAAMSRPVLAELAGRLSIISVAPAALSPGAAAVLHGGELRTSVSRLEQFAACPFKHFIASGLKGEERERFELDARRRGDFQHAVLAAFHREVKAAGRRWHDLARREAVEWVCRIADRMAPEFGGGVSSGETRAAVMVESMRRSLADFIDVMVGWMGQYEFEPEVSELGFGVEDAVLPGWVLDLGNGGRLVLRGAMDRVDLRRFEDGQPAFAVVIDYKSSERSLDDVMMRYGLQLQLPAYLAALRGMGDLSRVFGVERIRPAGVFYVSLRGGGGGGDTRADVLEHLDALAGKAFQHSGRFDLSALRLLDNRGEKVGTQFKFRLKENGEPYSNSIEAMNPGRFSEMLDQVERCLKELGQKILAGVSEPDPYQKGKERACDLCEFQGICRIDPWTHPFRVLKEVPTSGEAGMPS
jgi:ATP-dependent helicase/nuclease subunit B